MTVIDDLLANNESYAASFAGPRPMLPAKRVAVLTCMDARINVFAVLGLAEGDAHVIRNPGGVVAEPEIRALAISQRLLGTRQIVVIHHTDCGMRTVDEEQLKRDIEAEVGVEPPWVVEPLTDIDSDLRRSVARITTSPFVPHTGEVRGFALDLGTGLLREVSDAP
jgi:carbonic anhydrase